MVPDLVVLILDRYRLGHQPVISTWPNQLCWRPLQHPATFVGGPAVVCLLFWKIRAQAIFFREILACVRIWVWLSWHNV